MKARRAKRVKERGVKYATPERQARVKTDAPFSQARYLTRKERIVLQAFQDYLLGRYSDQVERVVLYGSKARGDGSPESDVDVLVVVGGAGSDKSWEPLSPNWNSVVEYTSTLALKYGVVIAPKFEHVDNARKWSPLLDHIHAEGVELWRRRGVPLEPWPEGGDAAMVLSKQEHVQARMAIAREKLKVARHLIEKGFYNDTISTGYYAMFYASKALLLALGEDPHKHAGVVSLFGERIAKVGLSDPKYGTFLRDAKDLREDADYGDFFHATREQAEDAIRKAEDFVNESEATLQRIQTRGR